MANAIQLRRGTTAEHSTFTGLVGEVTVDTTKDTIVVHDGTTAGGVPLATEVYVDTEVSTGLANLVNSAPTTLDTLNELATALGDDPNFATTVTNSIATKASLSGATFTGDVAGTNHTLSGDLSVAGTTSIHEVIEGVTTDATTSGTLTFDLTAQGVVYLTADQTANRTINISNADSQMAVGESMTVAVMATQGATAYYFNAYQVDGAAVTPKWQGGTAPDAGNASSIDVYTFTLIKTAASTFTVLASQTQFA